MDIPLTNTATGASRCMHKEATTSSGSTSTTWSWRPLDSDGELFSKDINSSVEPCLKWSDRILGFFVDEESENLVHLSVKLFVRTKST